MQKDLPKSDGNHCRLKRIYALDAQPLVNSVESEACFCNCYAMAPAGIFLGLISTFHGFTPISYQFSPPEYNLFSRQALPRGRKKQKETFGRGSLSPTLSSLSTLLYSWQQQVRMVEHRWEKWTRLSSILFCGFTNSWWVHGTPTPSRCNETLRSGKDASDTGPKSQGGELTKNEADREEPK